MIAGFVRRVCVAIAFLLLAAPASWAQNGGSISGAVVDPLGARVSGATLKLMLAGKAVKSGTSDSMGDFTFDGLAEGRYQIEASSPGFQTRTTDPMFVGGAQGDRRRRAADRTARAERLGHGGGHRRAAVANRRAGDRARFDHARHARQA